MGKVSLFIKEVFDAFPSIFWTAIGGFLVWLLTTLSNKSSNSHAREMQRDLLEYQAAERQRDRQYEVKSQVILPALEAGSQALSLLAELCRADIDPIGINEGIAKAGMKLSMASSMGTMETWTAISRLQNAISQLQSELSLMRGPIELENLNLKYAREQVAIANRELEAVSAEHRRLQGENGYQEADDQRVTRLFASSTRYFKLMSAQQVEAGKKLNEAMLQSFQRFRQELPALATLSLQCIVVLRAELGMPSDEVAMSALQAELLAKNDELLGAAADRVRSMYDA